MSFRVHPKSVFDPTKRRGSFLAALLRYGAVPLADEERAIAPGYRPLPSAWVAAQRQHAQDDLARSRRRRGSSGTRRQGIQHSHHEEDLHPGHQMHMVVSGRVGRESETMRYTEWNVLRTTLALERTMLSWERTVFALLSFSYGILKADNFLGTEPRWFDVAVGWTFALAAVFLWFAGGQRPAKMLSVIASSTGVVHPSKEACIRSSWRTASQFLIAVSVLVVLVLSRFAVTTIRCTLVEDCTGHNRTKE